MKLTEFILALPKSIYVNLKSVPFRQAIKLPILVSYRTKWKSLRGSVELTEPVKFGMVRFGLSGSGTASFMPVVIENEGTMKLESDVAFGGGCQVSVGKNAVLSVGKHTRFMGECHLISNKNMTIGRSCAISWNTQIMDTDFHKILYKGSRINEDATVEIGDHVWITSGVSILKGCVISNDLIISAGSTITGKVDKTHAIVTGMPLNVLCDNIEWAW